MRLNFLRKKPLYILWFLMLCAFGQTWASIDDTPDPNLEVSVNDQIICIGDMVNVEVKDTEMGVSYSLTIDGQVVGSSQMGNGGTLTFSSPAINEDATIGISATDVDATVDLQSFPIEVDTVAFTGNATGVTALGNDGDIHICVNQGIGPFNIAVSPANVTIREVAGSCLVNYAITGLEAGSYTVTISDAEGCSQQQTFMVAGNVCSNFKISSVEVEQPVSCFGADDGAIKVTLTKFDDLNTITVYPGPGFAPQTFTKDEIGDGSIFLTNLAIGEYNVYAVDDSGCQVAYMFNPVNLFGPDTATSIEYMTTDDTGAADGSVDLCVNGGNRVYGISISPETGSIANSNNNDCDGNFEISGLAAGDYTVYVVDGVDCLDSIQFTINPPACSFAIDRIEIDTVCAGATGTIRVITSGGMEPYDYNFGSGTFSQQFPVFTTNIASGNSVTFEVTDANGCKISYGKPIELALKSNMQTDICVSHVADLMAPNSGRIELCVTGGKAPYTVNVSGGGGSPMVTNPQNSGCADSFLIENLTGGFYTVSITDEEGCVRTESIEVMTQSCPNFMVDSVNVQVIECFGTETGALEIYTSGGVAPYQYFVTGYHAATSDMGDYVFDGLDSGTYYIHVIDGAGCTAPFISKIEVLSTEAMSTSFAFVPPCPGEANGEICLTPTGGEPDFQYTATFDDDPVTVVDGPGPGCNGNFHISNAEAGNYCIEQLDMVRCKASGMFALPDEAVQVSAETTPACEGQNIGTIDLSIGGGRPEYTIAWEGGQDTEDLTDLLPGTYTVSVTDTRGCQVVQPVTVAAYTIDLPSVVSPTCNDQNIGAIDVSPSGGVGAYTFTWNTGADTEDLTGLDVGTYTLNVMDSNGCVADLTEEITEYTMAVSVDEQGTCEGESNGSLTAIATGGIEPYSYTWSNNSNAMTNGPIPAGDYTVEVFDSNGCQVGSGGTVASFDVPTVNIEGDAIFPQGESSELNAVVSGGTPPYSFTWSPANVLSNSTIQNPVAFPGEAVNVQVVVTDANGCTATALINLQVFIPPIMPSGFTPNLDGNNDVFEPIFRGFQLDVTLFQVFDRWGQKVFEANDAIGWDGTYEGTDQPIGTYVYFLEYQDPEGNRETLKGQVTLLR